MRFMRKLARFALFTAIGLLFFSYKYLDDLARNAHGTGSARFIEEMTGAYAAFALFGFVIWMARRFPWRRAGWQRALIAHTGGALVFSLLKTTLMAASRAIIFPLAGLGHYDYGVMFFRYPMEPSNDVMVYAIMVGFINAFDRLAAARAAEVRAAELQAELAESKLENLRLQLHPHFLFNTLNAISSVMYEDVRKADTMLARLSDFLRVILNSTEVQEVSLDEELAVESMYIDIMKGRLESNLRLSLEIDPAVRNARVPSLLLQPILENSIRHGMASERNALNITIEVTRELDTLHIRIRDDGVGLVGNPRFGHGLGNVQSRLVHLYGENSVFSLNDGEHGGAVVTLVFPYRHA